MQITNRGIIFMLLAAPLLAAAAWLPLMQWVAVGYLLLVCLLIGFDWRTAESVTKRFDVRREPGRRQLHQSHRAQPE